MQLAVAVGGIASKGRDVATHAFTLSSFRSFGHSSAQYKVAHYGIPFFFAIQMHSYFDLCL